MGIVLNNNKKEKRKIITTQGELTINRTILRPSDKSSLEKLIRETNMRCIVPMDIELGIDRLPYKMTREMMSEVAFWAQNQSSFKAAEMVVKKIYGITVNSETIRQVSDYVGKIVFDEDDRNAEFEYSNIDKISFSKSKKGIIYIQVDGASLNTRQKDNDGSTWRENKLGMVFASDHIRVYTNKKGEKINKITKKEYTSYIGSVEGFKKHIFACAVRNGYGNYETTIVLSDGATWIRNMCEEIFPDAIQILDLYHLCENTYEYAKAIFKNDESKYKPWSEEIIDKFTSGKKAEVVDLLKNHQGIYLPKGTVNLQTYVSNNIDKIDYEEYGTRGYYVGSGAIESGNKVVLQKRMKLAGMRWNEETAQYLLSLRAKYESGLWRECVVDRLFAFVF
jgi:hypothetical protein